MNTREDLTERFESLVASCGERLLQYLLRRVPAEDAGDVAGETLATAWRRARVMPADDEQALWWLLAIARRTAANHRRGLLRRSALTERLRSLPMHVTPSVPSYGSLTLQSAVTQLADDDQELVRLVYWDGLHIHAAAAVLGIGDAAARKRLQRIRDRLRTELEAEDDVRQNV